MALPLVPLIAAGASLLGQGISALSAKRQQKKANEYNTAMWEKQNAYNTPEAQMNRYYQSGLNPHLMYGQGNSGNAAPAPEFEKIAPEGLIPFNGANSIAEFADIQLKQAQLDNLKTQNKVMEQDAALRTLQVAGTGIGNKISQLDLDRQGQLFQTSIDAAKMGLSKLTEDRNFTHAQNIRADIDSQNKTAETVERILVSKLGRKEAEIRMNNMLKDGRVKELEARLSDLGISPSTPWYAKALSTFLQNMGLLEKFVH